MMLGISMRYTGAHPLKKREWNSQVIRPVLEHMGSFWHQKFLRKHFTAEGGREYGYMKRKGEGMPRGSKRWRRSYTGRKFARFGHTRPLVFSGVSERLSRVVDVRATAKRARVVLPRGFNRRHAKSRIRMRDEVTAVSQQEEQVLSNQADRKVTERLDRIRSERSVKF
jgi:hypothetical protein